MILQQSRNFTTAGSPPSTEHVLCEVTKKMRSSRMHMQPAHWPPVNQLGERFIVIIKQTTPATFCLIFLLTSKTGQISF